MGESGREGINILNEILHFFRRGKEKGGVGGGHVIHVVVARKNGHAPRNKQVGEGGGKILHGLVEVLAEREGGDGAGEGGDGLVEEAVEREFEEGGGEGGDRLVEEAAEGEVSEGRREVSHAFVEFAAECKVSERGRKEAVDFLVERLAENQGSDKIGKKIRK